MGLKFLARSGEVIGGGLEGTKRGTFGCSWGMGLELLGDMSNQRGVEGPCLGRLVGDGCALCSVKGFCDGIQVEAPVSDFLEKVCGKN